MYRPSREEAFGSFWDRLAEFKALQDRLAEARREIDPAEVLAVNKGLNRCSIALRELRAAHRALPPVLLVRGGERELDELRRSLDRTSDALRELKISWADRNLGPAVDPKNGDE